MKLRLPGTLSDWPALNSLLNQWWSLLTKTAAALTASSTVADLDGSSAAGSSDEYSRGDHKHAISVQRYVLFVQAAQWSPDDGQTYYFSCSSYIAPSTSATLSAMYPFGGTITAAHLHWTSSVPSNENISIYVRKNNTTDYLIATVGDTNFIKVFLNSDMDVATNIGDYLELKVVCPTWATNPTNVTIEGYIYFE